MVSSLLEIPSESDLQPIDENDAAGSVRVAVPYKLKVSRFNQAARSVSGTDPTAKVVQYNYMYSCRLDQLRAVVVEAGVLCLLLKLKETAAVISFATVLISVSRKPIRRSALFHSAHLVAYLSDCPCVYSVL